MEFPPIPLPESGRWRHRAASGRELGSSPPGIPRPGQQRCLRGLCVSPWLTRCTLSCCHPASARSTFGKRDHPASKEAKFKDGSETSGLAGVFSRRGVLLFSSFLSLSSYCGHLAGVCRLSSHFLREGIKTKAFCRSCLFGCKTLLIGYNTVYEFSSQMSKSWSWSGILGLSHSVIFFPEDSFL